MGENYLDHVVINVKDDMDLAQLVFSNLGFTLTPRGYHTLGSINHLMMFGSDYMELIGFPEHGVANNPNARPDLTTAPFGINGLVFVFFHSFVSIILLELVNYIQHYGLERKKENGRYERFTDLHSWNSRHISANWSTFNLGLHAEHHQSASKPYPLLSQEEKAIEMPANYSVMLIMALIPPLWFFIMDRKIENLKTI